MASERPPERFVPSMSWVCCKCGRRMPSGKPIWRLGGFRYACDHHGPEGLDDRSTDVRPLEWLHP